jgi:DHA1 family tetracycline resistance protein-like MFS transporter
MRRAPALSFLLVTVFIDMLGLAIIVPIVPALMVDLTGSAAGAARWSGLIGSSYGLLQFLTAPLGLLVVFHALAGVCAGTTIVVNSYIADVTAPERRARAYGLVGSAFGLGFVAGPVLGGVLGSVGVRLPFYAAAGLAFANVAYGWFILPESRRGDRTTPLSLRAANPIGSIAAVLRRPVLGRLTLARFCDDLARNIHQSVWTFFVTYQFAWTTAHVGIVMSLGALAGAAFEARAVGPAVR